MSEGVLDSEQRGLRVPRLVELRRTRTVEHVQQGHVVGQDRGTALDRSSEHRLGVVELAPHSWVLRALPGEQKHGLRRAADALADPSRRSLVCAKRRQRGARHVDGVGVDDESVRMVRAPGVGREAHVA
ncbi:MAG TPA: hypothetical protein VGD80_09895 [Kofleriaceae bacterium]